MLGQALEFAVQVRLDPGEPLAPECISAEVTVGDRRLPAPLVRTAAEPQGAELARVRVLTSIAIDEPVVGVLLNVGCANRISRRYVILADPPIAPVAAAPAFAAVAALPEAAAVAGADPAAAAPGGAALAQPAATVVEVAAAPPPAARPPARPRRPSARAERAPQPVRVAAAAAPRADRVPRPRPAAAAAAEAPRLRLDLVEPTPKADAVAVDQALEAVAQAASAARAAAAATSAASERMAMLERTVEQLRAEAKGSRDFASQLRERMSRTETFARWLWPLVVAVLLLAALAAWLAWRLAAAQRQRQEGWRQAAVPPREPEPTPSRQLTRPIPFVTSEIATSGAAAARPRGTPAWPPAAPTDGWQPSAPDSELEEPRTQPQAQQAGEPPTQRTDVLPARASNEDASPRDVSIEELIDLEQQAEFFVVLGQDEAAVELLVEHLRHTGGGSPLPYLKLLEIYRRRGDRNDYERLRARFNHRYNAYAPDWDVDLQSGRTLEAYPGVVPRLQQVWARPLDAMAELEALLFRKSRGALFDLPAYREVLFLYALARDLLDREAIDSGNVDLLLPMADGGEFSSTAPAPYLSLEREAGASDAEDRPTAPVDFDLTAEAERPTSIFDPLKEPSETPRRR